MRFVVQIRMDFSFLFPCLSELGELIDMQCSKYNDWNAVAALQAVSVYFLLRLSEDNDDATNFDIPLIHTMIVRLDERHETILISVTNHVS